MKIMGIEIKQLKKTFGSFIALNQINLSIPDGKLVALLGPSGSGKTTLLRIIAGLEEPDKGEILFHGKNMTKSHMKERNIGFVFQHYALFRHMTVFENVAFGLKILPKKRRPSKEDIRERVMQLLRLVKLSEFSNHYPLRLSGGQKQRVALARALAVEPSVLLLDEPFGALDAKVRKELRKWLRKLHDEIHITSVFVTHDQEEALDVADQIVVMNQGRIEQVGSPEEVYEHPQNPFVYNFLGNVNLFHGRIQKGKLQDGLLRLDAPEFLHIENTEAIGYARPHHITIERQKIKEDMIQAIVMYIHAVGSTVHVELKRKDNEKFLEAELTKEQHEFLQLVVGEEVFVRPKELKIFIPEDFSI